MLRPESNTDIPDLTRLVAHHAFPNGSLIITMRDELGPIFDDASFADLYASTGQPAESPARLALVTVMQFIENLSDRQAADAVRGRIDWKYALGLELSDAGFDFSVLSEFRGRLVKGNQERLLLDRILACCDEKGLLKGKTKQRTDATHVLAAVRQLSLIELLGETVRRSLEAIARVAPDWLAPYLQPEWALRYGRRFDSYRLPKAKGAQADLIQAIGRDGYRLLDAAWHPQAPLEIRVLPMVELMRRIWLQRFYREGEHIQLRTKSKYGRLASQHLIAALDDLEATYCLKRTTEWVGYRVHLTETCDKDEPRLITQVETTTATTHDSNVTRTIQRNLEQRHLSPETHLVDEAYMDVDLLLESGRHGIDLVGPVPSGKSWQAREADAFDHTQFEVDWQKRVATCPAGKQSVSCSTRKTWRGTSNLYFLFDRRDCQPCPLRARCTRAKSGTRSLTLYPEPRYRAQEEARQRQKTSAFKKLYAQREGIEGTISQGVRRMGMRTARYLGLSRTHLQHVATASAINVVRAVDWLSGERPATTRASPFLDLMAQAA